MPILANSLTIVLVAAPWLVGVAIAFMTAANNRSDLLLVLCGLMGAVSYLLFGVIIWVTDQYGISLFKLNKLVVLLCIALIIAFCSFFRMTNQKRVGFNFHLGLRWNASTQVSFTLMFILLASNTYLMMLAPAQGWDVTDHWVGMAKSFIYHTLSPWDAPFKVRYLHPPVWSYLIAHAQWVGEEVGALQFNPLWTVPMALLTTSLLCVVCGWCRYFGINTATTYFFAYIALSIPLLEMHAKVPGYADLPLAIIYSLGAVSLALYLTGSGIKFLAISVILALLLVTLKNIGLIYSASLLLMAAFSILSKNVRIRSLLILVVVVAISILTIPSFVIDILGSRLGYSIESGSIYFGGRSLTMRPTTAWELSSNFLISYVANQSYSILVATTIMVSLQFLFEGRKGKKEKASMIIMLVAALSAFVALVASQFTQYGYVHSVPESDTGLSRFSFTVFLPLMFFLMAASLGAKICSNEEKNSR